MSLFERDWIMEASYELINLLRERRVRCNLCLGAAMSATYRRSVERPQSVERTPSVNAIEHNKVASIVFAKKRRERVIVAQEKRSGGVLPRWAKL